MVIEDERTIRSLNETNPDTSDFISQVLLVAHGVVGYGQEMEIPVARALANTFYERGIVGDELARLVQYTNRNAEKAYDVLTVAEELERFIAAKNL